MNDGSGGGVSNYEEELAESLDRLPDIDLITETVGPVQIPLVDPHIRRPFIVRNLINKLSEADIIHLPSQDYAPALIRNDIPQPVVVTVHDIIPYVTNLTPFYRKLSSHVSVKGLESADKVLSISEHTKKDVVKQTPLSTDDISVVYPSAELEFTDVCDWENIRMKYGISEDYILYVGSKAKRKNIYTLIKSMKSISDVDLVLVGRDPFPFKSEKINFLSKIHGVEDRVIQTGFVDQSELGSLYRNALAFVFPSLYEGFGRPPLEAMSIGTPVVASSHTAVPEVVGDAGLLCDPNNPKEWAQAVGKIKNNESLRDDLIESGFKRSNEFNFKKTVESIQEIYRELL